MTDTIIVTDTYTVPHGARLTFVDQDGFSLQADAGDVTLTLGGRIDVSTGAIHGEIAGVRATGDGLASVDFLKGGSFKVHATGDAGAAYGVDFAGTPGQVSIDTRLVVTGDTAAAIVGDQFDMDIMQAGVIEVSGGQSAVGIAAGHDSTVVNQGHMTVTSAHGSATGVSLLEDGTFTNLLGLEVTGAQFAEGALIGSGGEIDSQGFIHASAENAIGVELQGASLKIGGGVGAETTGGGIAYGVYITQDTANPDAVVNIFNGGGIAGQYAIIEAKGFHSGGVEHVTNEGDIEGDISLGFGRDLIVNWGPINGNVDLGNQNDTFQGSIGRISGALIGGGGDDLLVAGHGADHIFGDEPGGPAGDDTISGGDDADVLTGGGGADIFLYSDYRDSKGKEADLITDLDRDDHIDLSAIDADKHTRGDQAFHLVATLSGHAGELVLSYDAVKDITTVSGDVNGDGRADLEITIAGDTTGFTHFVL
jgi:hypothetical protein